MSQKFCPSSNSNDRTDKVTLYIFVFGFLSISHIFVDIFGKNHFLKTHKWKIILNFWEKMRTWNTKMHDSEIVLPTFWKSTTDWDLRNNIHREKQVLIPSTKQVQIPSTKQVQIPSTKQVQISSTKQVQIPSTKQVQILSTKQVQISSTKTSANFATHQKLIQFLKFCPEIVEYLTFH